MKHVATSLVSCSSVQVDRMSGSASVLISDWVLTVVIMGSSMTFAAGQRSEFLPGLEMGMTIHDFQIAGICCVAAVTYSFSNLVRCECHCSCQ